MPKKDTYRRFEIHSSSVVFDERRDTSWMSATQNPCRAFRYYVFYHWAVGVSINKLGE